MLSTGMKACSCSLRTMRSRVRSYGEDRTYGGLSDRFDSVLAGFRSNRGTGALSYGEGATGGTCAADVVSIMNQGRASCVS